MRPSLPLTPLLAFSSLYSLSIALPLISRPNNSHQQPEPVLVARAQYSVVPVDGGAQGGTVTVTQTVAASASAKEVYITVTAPAAVVTETVTGAVATQSVAKEFKTVYVPTTVYESVAAPTGGAIESSVGGNSTISTVTLSLSVTASGSSISAPSSTKVYDNGLWHTTYPVWSNSTTAPTQRRRRRRDLQGQRPGPRKPVTNPSSQQPQRFPLKTNARTIVSCSDRELNPTSLNSTMATPPAVEDQARLLEDALTVVRQQTHLMRKCLETPGKLMDALKCSSTLVSELRTSSLGPKQYYELYMSVFDALRHLCSGKGDHERHDGDESRSTTPDSRSLPALLPVRPGPRPPAHGQRGRTGGKPTGLDKLHPDEFRGDEQTMGAPSAPGPLEGARAADEGAPGAPVACWQQSSAAESAGRPGSVQECYLAATAGASYQFLAAVSRLNPHVNVKAIVIGLMDRLSAFAARETEPEPLEERKKTEEEALVKLLEDVRLSSEKKKEAEAVSAAEGEDDKKKEPEEATEDLPKYEAAEASEDKKEDKKEEPAAPEPKEEEPINGEDEASPAKKGRGILDNIKLYEIFFDQVMNLVTAQHLPIQDTTALLVSLANLALNIYPERLDYVDKILDYANHKCQQHVNSPELHSQATQTNILSLLQAPLQSYASIFTALSLPQYIPLINSQTYPTRRAIAGEVAKTLLKTLTKTSTVAGLESVLEILKVLIKEGSQPPAGYPGVQQRRVVETDETIEEQGWLARIVHLIHSDDNDTQFKLLQATKNAYSEGNERIKFTTPALITSAIKLANRYKAREHYDDNWSTQSSSLYKYMHSSLSTLYTRVNGSADLCLRQFVACGQIADQNGFEEVSYEFFAQAFTIYEEAVSDSRAQFQAVCIIAGALHETRNFSKENYDTLITKCALHGSKLLKKPDQCRAVYLASHLWWAVPIAAKGEEDEKGLYRDGKRVLECLQRALRVADACMDTAVSVELFVEILNRYVYYFDQQNEAVTIKYINGLIELIHSNLQTNQDAATIEGPRRHFERTLEYIASREYEGVVIAAAK
ncbi:hypothetical protein V490_06191 [Pseudogymnoascus sp. VKM F-3557]|nr:hypothetical protein V490_06191 [Pseudogymnoascus sp. VKM F-3557]